MRHNLLQDYLNTVELVVSSLTNVYVEHDIEKVLTPKRATNTLIFNF